MRISRIYTEENLSEGSTIRLDKAASSYLLKVLRLSEGAVVHLFNGQAVNDNYGYYKSVISSAGKLAEITTTKFIIDNNQPPLRITLFQGISKGDHMDTTIQKAVELGVTEIVPVICERTVVNLKADRLDKKMRHWNGIVTSACEQSGRNHLLTICKPVKFSTIELKDSSGFILEPRAEKSLQDAIQSDSVSLLIGPEGGFNEPEITDALNKGFSAIKFGPRILRTETAAIAAIAILQATWGDLN